MDEPIIRTTVARQDLKEAVESADNGHTPSFFLQSTAPAMLSEMDRLTELLTDALRALRFCWSITSNHFGPVDARLSFPEIQPILDKLERVGLGLQHA